MKNIIYKKVQLNGQLEESFSMFTENKKVKQWLAKEAMIEPKRGGKFELFWDLADREVNSTIGCKITAIEHKRLLCFEWKGPQEFAEVMNEADPLTHVSVFFADTVDGQATEIHLIHTGWGHSKEWEEARGWFDRVWENALKNLVTVMNK